MQVATKLLDKVAALADKVSQQWDESGDYVSSRPRIDGNDLIFDQPGTYGQVDSVNLDWVTQFIEDELERNVKTLSETGLDDPYEVLEGLYAIFDGMSDAIEGHMPSAYGEEYYYYGFAVGLANPLSFAEGLMKQHVPTIRRIDRHFPSFGGN